MSPKTTAATTEHAFTPYPTVGKFAEVRMLYCPRCGETQIAETPARQGIGPCVANEAHHDDCLHCAWKAAEAALPEGAHGFSLSQGIASGQWRAYVYLDSRSVDHYKTGGGPTPTEALNALTRALSEGTKP